jgi:hypothetical protein
MNDNSSISGNSAGNAGGGIITFTETKNEIVSAISMSDNAVIQGNTAKIGGGILLQDMLTMNDNAQIIENTATDRGGGVWGAGDNVRFSWAKDTVIENRFANNTAPDTPDTNFDFR